jgi:demethylmenaquinone methyltransferase / 2-methoxy-6-polyprenyl-1,4-benzoquinol methylase
MSEKLVLPKSDAPQMFNAIANRYDLLNGLLSLGQHHRWRYTLKNMLPKGDNLNVLDLATGTADVLIALAKDNPRLARGIGIDLAENMLKIGRRKIEEQGLSKQLMLEVGDAQRLHFLDDSFDCVTISFGIRNLPDLRAGLLEMYRVTKPGGRILILELSKPANPVLMAGHWVYLNAVVPSVGFLFSGNWKAYQYLNQTIQHFPYGERFCKILKQFGFRDVRAYPLMGGAATIYAAEK